MHRHSILLERLAPGGLIGLLLLVALAPTVQAQAPGSVFGQQPQQLSPQFQAPPSSSVAPFNKPTNTAPNWNAVGANPVPAFTPPAVSTQVRPPATLAAPLAAPRGTPAKPNAAAKNIRPPARVAGPKFTKFRRNRAALLQAQIKIRDEENRIAQGLRGHAAGQHVMEKPAGNPFAGAPGPTSSLAAIAAAKSPLSARNAKTQDALARQPPGIWSINGRQRGFVITPGGRIVIFGKGLGTVPGRILGIGLTGFPGGTAAFQIIFWGDLEIYAVLPAGIRGVPDLDGITLQVLTAGGKSFTMGNGKFVAAREEIIYAGDDRRFISFRAGDWTQSGWPDGGPLRATEMSSGGEVGRYEYSGDDLTCEHPGADDLYFLDLRFGFQVSGISMQALTRTDTGDGDAGGAAGNHMFLGKYDFSDFDRKPSPVDGKIVDHIAAYWGIFRDHESPILGIGGYDECTSHYGVTVWVIGPAGLKPF